MSPKRLTVEKLRRSAKNVRFDDVIQLLLRLGFTMRQKGSHATFTHPKAKEILTIPHPHGGPFVLPIYVRRIVSILDEAGIMDDLQADGDE